MTTTTAGGMSPTAASFFSARGGGASRPISEGVVADERELSGMYCSPQQRVYLRTAWEERQALSRPGTPAAPPCSPACGTPRRRRQGHGDEV